MPRLIDADALLEKEDATVVRAGGRGCGKSLLVACKSYLHLAVEAAPTIDAVPVVRCKNCKHFGGVAFAYTCRLHSTGNTRIQMGADDFCSRGERRSE